MSIVLMKENTVDSKKRSSQQMTMKSLRGMNIRPDSPRTLQACVELGMDQNVMEMKSYESFLTPDLSKDLVQLRYEHYLGRLNQSWIDIQKRRRDIMQRNRFALLQPTTLSPNLNSTQFREKVEKIHSKTLAYLQGSHVHPNITQPDEIISPTEEYSSLKPFQKEMEKDLKRYNRMKIQKIREASIKLEDENKKLQIMENLNRKHKQVYLVAIKQQNEHNQHKVGMKRLSRSKDQRMMEAEELMWLVKKSEKEQVRDKISKLNEKQRSEVQRKLKCENEDIQRDLQKKLAREIVQSELQKQQRENQAMSLQKIEDKIHASEQLHETQMQTQVLRMKDQLDREHSQFLKQKGLKEVQDQQSLSLLINKMVQKEQTLRSHLEGEIKEERNKRKLNLVRQRKTELTKNLINRTLKMKMHDLDEKFIKIDENNISRKVHQEDMILYRQELRRLKDSDKQENQERCQRINDNQMQKTIQKSRNAQSRLEESKIQKSILQQTSLYDELCSNLGKYPERALMKDKESTPGCKKFLTHSIGKKLPISHYHQICDINNKPQSEQAKARSLKILRSLFGERDFINKTQTKLDILTLLRPQPEPEKDSPNSNKKIGKW